MSVAEIDELLVITSREASALASTNSLERKMSNSTVGSRSSLASTACCTRYFRVTSSPKTRLIVSGSFRFSLVTLPRRNSLSSSCTVTTSLPIFATTWLFGASAVTSVFLPHPANAKQHMAIRTLDRKIQGELVQIIIKAPRAFPVVIAGSTGSVDIYGGERKSQR